jgi:hypothetical protein
MEKIPSLRGAILREAKTSLGDTKPERKPL